MKFIWVEIFIWGVREGNTSPIWGYADGYNFDLGVQEYQKVENPWSRTHMQNIKIAYYL